MKSAILAVASAALVAAAPTKVLQARSTSICGQWDSVETGSYTVYQDLWNEDAGTGSQCTTVDSLTDNVLVWSTEWSWSGGSSDVKSFANVVTTTDITTLSNVASISTTWDWTYTGTDIVADVAYDLFTSSTASGDDEYEIMIWLSALGGAGPISSTGSAVATPTINSASWSLYSGANGDMTVYSFVASENQTSFTADLTDFLSYLVDNEGLPDTQYLISIGAGTEPFTGSDAVFSVSAFSLSLTEGTASSSSSSSASSAAASVAATTTAAATSAAAAAQTTSTSAAAVQATSSTSAAAVQVTTSTSAAAVQATTSAAAAQDTTSAAAVQDTTSAAAVQDTTSAAAVQATTSAAAVQATTSAAASSAAVQTTATAATTSAAATTPSACKARVTTTVYV